MGTTATTTPALERLQASSRWLLAELASPDTEVAARAAGEVARVLATIPDDELAAIDERYLGELLADHGDTIAPHAHAAGIAVDRVRALRATLRWHRFVTATERIYARAA